MTTAPRKTVQAFFGVRDEPKFRAQHRAYLKAGIAWDRVAKRNRRDWK